MSALIRYVGSGEIVRGLPTRAVIRISENGTTRFVSVVVGRFNQFLPFVEQDDINYKLFVHDDGYASELVSGFVESTGLDIPRDFENGTDVYSVPGFIKSDDVPVPFVVMRQQIFLSAATFPVPQEATAQYLYHALGNALWNFLDSRVWRDSQEEKRRYREIRGLSPEYDPVRKRKNIKTMHQQSLFYIAAEDFRYLFGSSEAGRNKWMLDIDDAFGNRIHPPSPEVIEFWKMELDRYGSRRQEEIVPQEETPTLTAVS